MEAKRLLRPGAAHYSKLFSRMYLSGQPVPSARIILIPFKFISIRVKNLAQPGDGHLRLIPAENIKNLLCPKLGRATAEKVIRSAT